MNSRRGFIWRTVDVLLGRPVEQGRPATYVRLMLILLWHFAILVGCLVLRERVQGWVRELQSGSSTGYRGGGPAPAEPMPPPERDGLPGFTLIAFLLATSVAFLGALAYIPFRLLARAAPQSLGLFVCAWWRACLWGSVFYPALAAVSGVVPRAEIAESVAAACACACAVVAPGLVYKMEFAARVRRTRWRPECPECGYSLRWLQSPRCPECGVELPTQARVFRRWAIRRAVWDRLQRGNLLVSYLRMLFMITLCPCRVARRLAIPDRLPRAARWGALHIGLLGLAASLLTSDLYYPRQFIAYLRRPTAAGPVLDPSEYPPEGVTVGWAAQTFGAWLIGFAALPLLAVALAAALPGLAPAARRGLMKWSLYSTAILLPTLIGWYGAQLSIRNWAAPGWATRSFVRWFLLYGLTTVPEALLAVVYGLWWARGVAANPYLCRRGPKVFMLHAALYVVAWIVLVEVLFRPGPLADLL